MLFPIFGFSNVGKNIPIVNGSLGLLFDRIVLHFFYGIYSIMITAKSKLFLTKIMKFFLHQVIHSLKKLSRLSVPSPVLGDSLPIHHSYLPELPMAENKKYNLIKLMYALLFKNITSSYTCATKILLHCTRSSLLTVQLAHPTRNSLLI